MYNVPECVTAVVKDHPQDQERGSLMGDSHLHVYVTAFD